MDWMHLAQDSDRGGSCEPGNELSGSMKCWEILVCLSGYWLFKKDSALVS
jgi:hypothetical protein